MNPHIFTKFKFFSLTLFIAVSLSAMDPHEEGIGDAVKGTGEKIIKKLSEASMALQGKAVDAAGWAVDNWKKARVKAADQVQHIKESDMVKQAQDMVQNNYKLLKDTVELQFKKAKNGISERFGKQYTHAAETSKDFLNSWKEWLTGKSKLSSDELVLIGGAVVAVITVGGITYVLYKNGTIKKIGDTISDYPVLTALSTVTAGLLCALIYKTYSDSKEVKTA